MLVLFTVLLSLLFSPGTPLLGQNNGVSPVSNHLWEPATSSRLVGVPPTRREIPPRLGPSVRRWDLIESGQPSDPEGKGPVVPTWNNSGLHRSPPLAPVVATDSVVTAVSVWGASTTHPVAAFRLRHDAGAFSLLGACIQDSSQARYRQGWALWKIIIRLYFGTSDSHTMFPEGAVLRSVGMAFVHYLYTDQQRSSPYVDQTLSHVSPYYKDHGRCSDALRSPAVLGVKRAVRLDYATRNETSFHRGHGSTGYHLPPCSGFHGGPFGGVSFSATCFVHPSTSTRLGVSYLATVY
jgi:hypothetical protein